MEPFELGWMLIAGGVLLFVLLGVALVARRRSAAVLAGAREDAPPASERLPVNLDADAEPVAEPEPAAELDRGPASDTGPGPIATPVRHAPEAGEPEPDDVRSAASDSALARLDSSLLLVPPVAPRPALPADPLPAAPEPAEHANPDPATAPQPRDPPP